MGAATVRALSGTASLRGLAQFRMLKRCASGRGNTLQVIRLLRPVLFHPFAEAETEIVTETESPSRCGATIVCEAHVGVSRVARRSWCERRTARTLAVRMFTVYLALLPISFRDACGARACCRQEPSRRAYRR